MGRLNAIKKVLHKQKSHGKDMSNVGNVFQSIWIRCGICLYIQNDRELIHYRRCILWSCAFIFWSLFYLVTQ